MIGSKIQFFRNIRGYTLEELAQKVHLSKTVLSRIESGERALVDEEEIMRFANVLEVPREYITTAQPFFINISNSPNSGNNVGFVSIPKEIIDILKNKDEIISRLIERLEK